MSRARRTVVDSYRRRTDLGPISGGIVRHEDHPGSVEWVTFPRYLLDESQEREETRADALETLDALQDLDGPLTHLCGITQRGRSSGPGRPYSDRPDVTIRGSRVLVTQYSGLDV